MAGMQFDIQDKASVEEWKRRAQDLNDRSAKVTKDAAQVLKEFNDAAEGQIFDQVVEYSGQVISGVDKILEGMNEVLDAVNKFVTEALARIGELVTGVKDTSKNVIG